MLKFGIVGTNWITDSFIKAAHFTEKAILTNVYSRTKEQAKDFAKKYEVEKIHTDLEEMLAEPIDFIYIASPNALHEEQILQGIRANKHIFCEKPLVYNEQQWMNVEHEAKEKNVFVFEGFRHLYTPNFYTLKEKVTKIGQVRSAILHFLQYSSRYDAFQAGERPNVFTKEFAGGALMDLGVYPLSLAIDLFGEPKDIHYYPVLLKNGIDGGGSLILLYDHFNITILISKIAQGTIPSEIHGERGTITLDHIAPIQSLTFTDLEQNKSIELAQEQHEEDMVYQIEAFVQMIRERQLEKHDEWLERSRQVIKWTETARKKAGILFPSEDR